MRISTCWYVLALCLSVCAWGSPGEFTLDQNTLLLAHFNESVTEADYANGWPAFGGSGATQVDGYYGKGIDLRGIQFRPDFVTSATARTPMLTDWGIWPRANVDLRQGTYEFWFRVSPDGLRQALPGQQLLFTFYYQANAPGEIGWMVLTREHLTWDWFTTTGDKVRGEIPFSPTLHPDDWHHFAMSWSPGEWAFFIDGRVAYTHDMRGMGGPLLYGVTHKPLYMSGIVMDELRVSNVARYCEDFEPAWREGSRPAHAFAPAVSPPRYSRIASEPVVPHTLTAPRNAQSYGVPLGNQYSFDRKSGFLLGFGAAGRTALRGAHGLLLWEDVDRKPQFAAVASNWTHTLNALAFDQTIGNRLSLHHELMGSRWSVTIGNLTDREIKLEALLSLPMPLTVVNEYFDMSYAHRKLSLPRRRDEYIFSLPFVAVSGSTPDVDSVSVGVGIDPHTDLSALISEFIPEDDGVTVRQGTRLVLGPKENATLDFVIMVDRGDFGVLSVLERYQQLFPDLYQQRPDVPIYSYMPVCRYFEEFPYQDLARQTFMGMQWGHGPDHEKGDEHGTERYWNMPKDLSREDHANAYRDEDIWKSIAGLRENRQRRTKAAYDTAYTLRRSHYLPNWAAKYVIEDLYPEGIIGGDPLVTGQYYDPGLYYANEHGTPLGEHYQRLTLDIMKENSRWGPGFINDMCQTSPIRFTDPVALRAPGRAFSRDRGEYVVGAFGHADRYRLINSYVDERGFRQSIWSDGGVVSYQLSALSAADAIESYVIPLDFTSVELGNQAGRNLLGEKPMAVHYANESDWIGRFFDPGDFSPATLRDWYRYIRAQEMLSALKHGIYLPLDVSRGNLWMMEHNPILVESIVNGRKTVPGARIAEPLFVRKGGGSGNVWDEILVIGNEQPMQHTSDVEVVDYHAMAAPIFAEYLGAPLHQRVTPETVRIQGVTVPARGVVGLKRMGTVLGDCSADIVTSMLGDGLTFTVSFTVEANSRGELDVNPFAPLYEMASVEVNGAARKDLHQHVPFPSGASRIAVHYRLRALQFSSEDLRAVELLKDGNTNCRLIAPNSAFDRGTAGMLNQFIRQYDEEDGIIGNLAEAPILASSPGDFAGWTVSIDPNAQVTPARVRIARGDRQVFVEGVSPGEARRAFVVFLRLLDRKYPHIGRPFPIRDPWERGRKPWQYLDNEDTQRFFRDFVDPDFLLKPILRPEDEPLYATTGTDFEGTYRPRFSPFVFEPTYEDDYVYGYTGEPSPIQ